MPSTPSQSPPSAPDDFSPFMLATYLDDLPYNPDPYLTSPTNPVEEVNAQSEPANSDAGLDAA